MILGVGVRIGAIGAATLMAFVFVAADVWPENNPINSRHIIEMVAFLGTAYVGAGPCSPQRWFDG